MNIHSTAVHAGDRKRAGEGAHKRRDYTPSTTPIHLASTYFYDTAETVDKIFAHEEHGYSYLRYDNPTVAALEEVVNALEGGHGTIACASGMAALHLALHAVLLDRPKRILCASQLYGATINMLTKVMEPFGTITTFVDICDLAAVEQQLAEIKPAVLLMETVSNPTLRVADLDALGRLCRAANCVLMVDNTFATPMLVRPMEHGAHVVVHSGTKYFGGHGDVMAGLVTYDAEHEPLVRQLSRTYGPVIGPFEAYLTMRGIKTFPLRMERQCENAAKLAAWLRQDPRVERVIYLDDPAHPDRAVIDRLFAPGLSGAMVSFTIRGAEKADVFRFMDALKMVVPATSLGDVHTLCLYPLIASHRDVPPKQRARLGITDNLVRFSLGIEGPADIIADISQAMG
ncbi:MAG: PLP-dependent aspartate aminotransferase family protein [Bryobacteraceae bacterium]|nr:PLP-dependent aspartate aminotransferase family protein [Bryobacteraceae bacterium]